MLLKECLFYYGLTSKCKNCRDQSDAVFSKGNLAAEDIEFCIVLALVILTLNYQL